MYFFFRLYFMRMKNAKSKQHCLQLGQCKKLYKKGFDWRTVHNAAMVIVFKIAIIFDMKMRPYVLYQRRLWLTVCSCFISSYDQNVAPNLKFSVTTNRNPDTTLLRHFLRCELWFLCFQGVTYMSFVMKWNWEARLRIYQQLVRSYFFLLITKMHKNVDNQVSSFYWQVTGCL